MLAVSQRNEQFDEHYRGGKRLVASKDVDVDGVALEKSYRERDGKCDVT